MRIRNPLTIVVSLMLGLAGCSKPSPAVVHTKHVDLGVVQVSNGDTLIYDLGDGQKCTTTSTVLTNKTIVLQMKIERDGQILSKPRIQTTSGVGVAFESGDVSFTMTPVIRQ